MKNSKTNNTGNKLKEGRELKIICYNKLSKIDKRLKKSGIVNPPEVDSVFYPIEVNELKRCDYIDNLLFDSGKYGELYFSGIPLTIYDEDILLAFYIAFTTHQEYTLINDSDIYFSGPVDIITKILKNKINLQNIFDSIERIELVVSSKYRIKNDKYAGFCFNHIINYANIYDNKYIKIEFNTVIYDFIKYYINTEKSIKHINERLSLPDKDLKAMHRFIISNDLTHPYDFVELYASMNMKERPLNEQHILIDNIINKLIEYNVLDEKSGFIDSNNVILIKKP